MSPDRSPGLVESHNEDVFVPWCATMTVLSEGSKPTYPVDQNQLRLAIAVNQKMLNTEKEEKLRYDPKYTCQLDNGSVWISTFAAVELSKAANVERVKRLLTELSICAISS